MGTEEFQAEILYPNLQVWDGLLRLIVYVIPP